MPIARLVILSVVALALACLTTPSAPGRRDEASLTVCILVTEPQVNGRDVVVTGLAQAGLHYSIEIIDDNCPSYSLVVQIPEGVTNDAEIRRLRESVFSGFPERVPRVRVTLRGRYTYRSDAVPNRVLELIEVIEAGNSEAGGAEAGSPPLQARAKPHKIVERGKRRVMLS
jgi:hypothetical protein